ncbi:MAG: hypothetical protein KF764_27990 [Labilithrix sp.]|nr:hypothetical protein [Labilithrix sp.]
MSLRRSLATTHRLSLALGLALLSVPPLLVASCADSAPDADLGPDAAPPTTDDDASDPIDAGGPPEDAGCEAGDPRCAETELPCAETDFCPVTGVVDARYALTAIWGSSKDDVWAVGSAGTVLHWDGQSWKPRPVATGHTLFGVWGSGAGELWAGSTYTASFRGTIREDASVEWTTLPPLPVPSMNDLYPALATVWGRAPDDVWFVGGDKVGVPYARVWRTRPGADGGVAWQTLAPCTTGTDCPAVRAIWGRADDDIWLVGDRGRTYHAGLTDGGVAFTAVESQTTQSLRAVWGASASEVWSAGDDGVVRKASATAPSWTPVDVPTSADLRGLWGSSASDLWAVGAYGTILHFDGEAWTQASAAFPTGLKPHLYAIWGSGPNDVWIVGEGILLHRSGPAKSGGQP